MPRTAMQSGRSEYLLFFIIIIIYCFAVMDRQIPPVAGLVRI